MDIVIEPDEVRAIARKAEWNLDELKAATRTAAREGGALVAELNEVPAAAAALQALLDHGEGVMDVALRTGGASVDALRRALDDWRTNEEQAVDAVQELHNVLIGKLHGRP